MAQAAGTRELAILAIYRQQLASLIVEFQGKYDWSIANSSFSSEAVILGDSAVIIGDSSVISRWSIGDSSVICRWFVGDSLVMRQWKYVAKKLLYSDTII